MTAPMNVYVVDYIDSGQRQTTSRRARNAADAADRVIREIEALGGTVDQARAVETCSGAGQRPAYPGSARCPVCTGNLTPLPASGVIPPHRELSRAAVVASRRAQRGEDV